MDERIRRSPGRPKIADKSREQKILFDCRVMVCNTGGSIMDDLKTLEFVLLYYKKYSALMSALIID